MTTSATPTILNMSAFYVANTFHVPDSITAGLGVVDQSFALADWVGTIPNGPGALWVDGQLIVDEFGQTVRGVNKIVVEDEYRVDKMFRPIGRVDLAFDFGTAGRFTRVAPQPGEPHFVLNHCSFCYVDYLRVQGEKPSGAGYDSDREAEHGVRFEGSFGCKVRWARIDDVWGDHFYFGKTNLNSKLSENCKAIGAICGEAARHSVSFTAARNCEVARSRFGVGRGCIDAEPNGHRGGVYDCTVDRCTFDGPYTGIFLGANAPDNGIGVVDGLTVSNNVATSTSLQGIIGGGKTRANITIVNNRADRAEGNSQGALLRLHNVSGDIVITDNHCPVQTGRGMMVGRIFDSPDAQVTYERNWNDDGNTQDA